MAKKITGRKRHVLVDTEGCLTELVVHEADIQESVGAERLLTKGRRHPRLRKVWVDGGDKTRLVRWAAEELGLDVEIVSRAPGAKGFAVVPRRWVVERSFAWLGRSRRFSKDDEALTETSEALIWAACGTTLLRRLARQRTL